MRDEARVSTGVDGIDGALGGLFRGDNLVWLLDGTSVEPFYRAIASQSRVFDARIVVALGDAVNTFGAPGVAAMDVVRGGRAAEARQVLGEIQRLCRRPDRRLFLFPSLDAMARTWGVGDTRRFFVRVSSLLLDAGAIAYWSMAARDAPAELHRAVAAVAQCVLRVDERSVQVLKAEGRRDAVIGTVLRWHVEAGRPLLAPPEVADRVAASLRAIRHARHLSQHDLGDMAGVTASAISQVERAERGLALSTVARLSTALGITIDGLLSGASPEYRIGRRSDGHGSERPQPLLGADPDHVVELVRLGPRQSGGPVRERTGQGIIAVAAGLVQVTVAGQTPTLRRGEVLVADSARIERWRNLGHGDAMAFWIVCVTRSAGTAAAQSR